jgi:hypothetical protein
MIQVLSFFYLFKKLSLLKHLIFQVKKRSVHGIAHVTDLVHD